MRLLLDHTLLFLLFAQYAYSYVAKRPAQVPVLAAKTYAIYDASPTEDASRARMTRGLHPRQLMDPDSQMAQYFNSRPTSYPSIPYAPASVNNTDICVLWDPNCKGDKDKALVDFFGRDGVRSKLFADSCFTTGPDWNSECTETPKPDEALITYWSTVRSFMRKTQCMASMKSAHDLVSTINDESHVWDNCCGNCGIGGPNLEVYYWESPNANTDCLKIIGTDVRPPLEGATTVTPQAGEPMTYWGVVTSPGVEWKSVKTTMIYTSINGIYFKMPVSNPWDDPALVAAMTKIAPNNAPASPPGKSASITPAPSGGLMARANLKPINPRQVGQNASLPLAMSREGPSTVVYNGHTFTSPSIYVDFFSLRATDMCGYLGKQNIITSTLLAFDPGELSTYGGPLTSLGGAHSVAPTPYNFEDLPCPPKDVMYDQWYMPEPGQPYRPIIAFPPKLNDLDPAWKSCTPRLFTGYDPPRDLAHATVMAPNNQVVPDSQVTGVPMPEPHNRMGPNKPGPDLKNGEEQLVPDPNPNPDDTACNGKPCDEQPKKEAPPSQDEPPANGGTEPQQNPPAQGNSPAKVNQPQPAAPPKQNEIVSDPNNVSNEDMDKIKQALKPAPAPVVNNSPAGQNTNQNKAANPAAPAPAPAPNDNVAQQKNNKNPAPAQPQPQQKPIAKVGGKDVVPIVQPNNANPPLQNNGQAGKKEPNKNVPANNNSPINAQVQNPQQPQSPQVYQVGNQKVTAGGSAIKVDNTPVFAPSTGGVVVGKKTFHAPPAAVPTTQNLGGHQVVAGPNGYAVDNTPVKPGAGPITASNGQVLKLDSDNQLHVNDQVYHMPAAGGGAAAPAPTTIAGQRVVPLPNQKAVVVGGQTISQGGPPINIAGTPFSLGPANSLMVDNKPFALPTALAPAPTTLPNNEVVTPLANGNVLVQGSTLRRGAPALTINNRPVSLDRSGNLHFPGQGTSYALPPITSGPGTTILNHEPLAPAGTDGAVSIHGTTLTPGAPAITGNNGELIKLRKNGALVVGTATLRPKRIARLASQSISASLASNTATTVGAEKEVIKPVKDGVVVDGKTLTPGQTMTGKGGEVVSFGGENGGLVVGGSITVGAKSGENGWTLGGSITPAKTTNLGPAATTAVETGAGAGGGQAGASSAAPSGPSSTSALTGAAIRRFTIPRWACGIGVLGSVLLGL